MKTGIMSAAVACAVFVSCTLFAAAHAHAQAPPPDGWTAKGELTSVLAAGNAEAFTFGLGSSVENRKGKNLLKLEAGGLRSESVKVTREAWGSASSFQIVKNEDRQKTAEAYYARARYDRAVSERFFVFGATDWMRNTFAGIDSRTVLAVGAGNTWADNERTRFRTNVAGTWTFQTDVVENPAIANSFAGLRAGWELWRKVTATTEFESRLVGDLNLDQTDDVRGDFTNSLAVAISSVLALKPSLQVLWRNQPSLTAVPLFTTSGVPLNQKVLVPLEKMDLLFRLALVVKL